MSMYPRSRFFPPQGQKNKIQSTYSYAQYPQNSDHAAVLIQAVRHEGGRPSKQSQRATVLPDGVSKSQSHHWQLEALAREGAGV